MSVPTIEFQQPPFPQGEGTATEPRPAEPTSKELGLVAPSGASKQPYPIELTLDDKLFVIIGFPILFTVLALLITVVLPAIAGGNATDEPSVTRTSTCPSGQVEVERYVPGDNSACVTIKKHGELLNKAASQYDEEVARGESVYKKWLTQHKLAPKTEATSVLTAKRYICKSSGSGDGPLYAATIADLNEGVLTFVIDGYVIRLAEYNPEDQSCYKGAPLPAKKSLPPPSGMERPTSRP